MRSFPILLATLMASLLVLDSCAPTRLARSDARRQISELGPSKLIPDAVEIRSIDAQGQNLATVASTVTLAFLFKRPPKTLDWEVAAIRFGEGQWIDMSEVTNAIAGPAASAATTTPIASFGTQIAGEVQNFLEQSGALSALDEERKRITELDASRLVPSAITVRRVILQTPNQAIAEATVSLSFQFKKNGLGGRWYIANVRLGERNWIDVNDLFTALNQDRQRETEQALKELAAAIEAYRKATGGIPKARNIRELDDILQPQYMSKLIRFDAWGHLLEYEVQDDRFRIVSRGPDGILGTRDDIVVEGGGPSSP